eukprot:CAMPEP_0202858560 /NCGR_PEP_ID=MMETSP1391-20130828/1038_1 /ASSEMBLY_ACC=CAM_ASM_000867 /TAXON_ID=1034604 /ORGANISM="Chlamydomonas leiostraca, Strain SAG 11-49" /LENGTH=329 /DNA_ID=CAMNT_0049537487 /DNA_START=169 /DNA_END=1158 /DNA_ORIENTATION=+
MNTTAQTGGRESPNGTLPALWHAAQKMLLPGRQLTNANIETLKELLRKVTLEDLGFPETCLTDPTGYVRSLHPGHPLARGEVTYQHIYEDDRLTLGIFMLPEGASIPLHNHPHMTVVSRLLWGQLAVRAYDAVAPLGAQADGGLLRTHGSLGSANMAAAAGSTLLGCIKDARSQGQDSERTRPLSDPDSVAPSDTLLSSPSRLAASTQPSSPSLLSALTDLLPGGLRGSPPPRAARFGASLQLDTVLTAPAAPLTVTPTHLNLHEFTARGGPAAVLDLLTPPYNSALGRDCTYYRQVGAGRRLGVVVLEEYDAPDFNVVRAPYLGVPLG